MQISVWDLLINLVPQVLAAVAKIRAAGGHGHFAFDLAVVDKATGQDIIPDAEVFEVNL